MLSNIWNDAAERELKGREPPVELILDRMREQDHAACHSTPSKSPTASPSATQASDSGTNIVSVDSDHMVQEIYNAPTPNFGGAANPLPAVGREKVDWTLRL